MDDPLPSNLVQCWEDFLSSPKTLDDLFAHPVLFPLQRRREMEAMHNVAREYTPETVMEIGADKGGSVWAWIKALPSVKYVIACEVRGTPYSQAMEKAFPHIKFLWLPVSSYAVSTVKAVKDWLGGGITDIDVLFIDGDKSHFDTDYKLYSPLVRGVVFMHDVVDSPMREAFAKCSTGKRAHMIHDVSEWEELRDNPLATPTPHQDWLMYWHGRSCSVGVIEE